MQGTTDTKRTRKPVKTEKQEPEKKADAETAKPVEAPAAAVFTEEQVRKMIEEAVQRYVQENQPAAAPETASAGLNDGLVTMIFQAEVNDANEIQLGPNAKFGMITGKQATITIAKRDFIGEFRTTTVQQLLRNRNLIVVDGLTDDERRVYGLDYQEGEYLEPAVYERLLNMGDKILEIYPKLHKTWREMIAVKFTEAYENKKLKCSRDVLLKLNQISKKDYTDLPKQDMRRKGGFYAIIHAMNAEDEMPDDTGVEKEE